MKTKTILSTRFSLLLPTLTFLTIGSTVGACATKFEDECPPGTVQNGGGDVNDPNVCQTVGGSGGAPGSGGSGGAPQAGGGGTSGTGGGTGGTAGSGGSSGGVCAPNATKCEGGAQQTCDAQGQWGAAAACEIACNGEGEGKACLVPVQLAAGAAHVCALLSDGTARCWGRDSEGELGNGPAADSSRPVAVVGLANATKLDAHESFTCALLSDKSVSCWGKNFLSGTGVVQQAPTALAGAVGVKDLGVTNEAVCVIKETGAVQCVGQNGDGQLGNGGTAPSSTFASTSAFPSPPLRLSGDEDTFCAALSDGNVFCWGEGNNGQNGSPSQQDLLDPTLVPSNVRSIQNVFVAGGLSCAVREDKNVQCWGRNEAGQLGRGSVGGAPQAPGFVPDFGGVEQMAIGRQHVCAAKSDKTLWCWGSNSDGQLGNACEAIGCSESADGVFYVASPAKVPLDNVTGVAAALDFTCAITADGKVYCWGTNNAGQLGNGTVGGSASVPTPVAWKLTRRRDARQYEGPAGLAACVAAPTGDVAIYAAGPALRSDGGPGVVSRELRIPSPVERKATWRPTPATHESTALGAYGQFHVVSGPGRQARKRDVTDTHRHPAASWRRRSRRTWPPSGPTGRRRRAALTRSRRSRSS